MNITLEIKRPGNNTNEDFGNINIRVKGQLAYIRYQDKDIIVNAEELYKAVHALTG